MALSMKRLLMLAGVCSLAIMFAGEHQAQAGIATVGKITVSGTYKPVTPDPQYLYDFKISLNAPVPNPNGVGTNTFSFNDSITFNGLPGVTSGSLSSAPPTMGSPPTVAWAAAIDDLHTAPPDSSNITWTFLGSQTYSASTPAGPADGPPGPSIFLGEFQVLTTANLSAVPFPDGGTVTFSYTIDGVTTPGQFQIFAVPEPSSVILLAAGVGLLPVFWLRDRRRRQKQQPI